VQMLLVILTEQPFFLFINPLFYDKIRMLPAFHFRRRRPTGRIVVAGTNPAKTRKTYHE